MDFDSAMRASGGDAVAAAALVFAQAPEDKRGADETFGDPNPARLQSMRGYDTDDTAELSFSDDDDDEQYPANPADISEEYLQALTDETLVPGIVSNILMNLNPAELKQACATSKAFRKVCLNADFRAEYHRTWYIPAVLMMAGRMWHSNTATRTESLDDFLNRMGQLFYPLPPSGEYVVSFDGYTVSRSSSMEGMRAYVSNKYPHRSGVVMLTLIRIDQGMPVDEVVYVYPGGSRAGTRYVLPAP